MPSVSQTQPIRGGRLEGITKNPPLTAHASDSLAIEYIFNDIRSPDIGGIWGDMRDMAGYSGIEQDIAEYHTSGYGSLRASTPSLFESPCFNRGSPRPHVPTVDPRPRDSHRSYHSQHCSKRTSYHPGGGDSHALRGRMSNSPQGVRLVVWSGCPTRGSLAARIWRTGAQCAWPEALDRRVLS